MPKWWLLHVFIVVAVLCMLRLGLWQWHRANSASGGIQNYAYAFQWPIFAVFALVLWVRTLLEEGRRDPEALAEGRGTSITPEADIVQRPGLRIGLSTPPTDEIPGAESADDPEVEAWNARLAALQAATSAVEGRRR
jgi:DNA-binding transcriptional regulator of glucitol operon